MNDDHNQTFKIELKGIVLIDDDSRVLPITNFVDTFSIDYSLFSNSISATFQITDFDSLLSDFQINGNESVVISFKTPSLTLGKYEKFKDDINLMFRVLSIKDRKITAARASTYLLHCVSLEYVNNERLSVQRTYSDLDGSEIIRDIYGKFLKPKQEEYGPEDNGNPLLTKNLNFTKTGNNIHLNFVNDKPFDAIQKVCSYSEYTEKDTSPTKNAEGTKKDPVNKLSEDVKEQAQKVQAQTKQVEVAVNKFKQLTERKVRAAKRGDKAEIEKVVEERKKVVEDLGKTLEKTENISSPSLQSATKTNAETHDELNKMVIDAARSGSSAEQERVQQRLNELARNGVKLSPKLEAFRQDLNAIDARTNARLQEVEDNLQRELALINGTGLSSSDQIQISSISAEIDLQSISGIQSKLGNSSAQLNKFVQGSLFTDLQNQIQNKLNFKNIFNSSKTDDILKSLRVKSLVGGNPAEKLGLETAFAQLGLDKAFSAFNGSLNFDVNDLVKESGFDNLTDLLNSKGADQLLETFQNKLTSSVNKTLNSGIDLKGLVNDNLSGTQNQLANITKTGLSSETLDGISTDVTNLQSKMTNVFDDPNIQKSIGIGAAQEPTQEFVEYAKEVPIYDANGNYLGDDIVWEKRAVEKAATENTFGLNSASDSAGLTDALDNISTSSTADLANFNQLSKGLSDNVTSSLSQKKISSLSSELSASLSQFSSVTASVKAGNKLPDISGLSKKLEFNSNKLLKEINSSEITGKLKDDLLASAKKLKFTTDSLKEIVDKGVFDSLKESPTDSISGLKSKFGGLGSVVSKATDLETKLGSLDKVVGELGSSVTTDLFKGQISSLQKSVVNLAQTSAPEVPGLLDSLSGVTDSLINDATTSLLGEVGNSTEFLKSAINDFSLNLDPSELAEKIGLNLNKLGKFDKDNLDLERIKELTGVNLLDLTGGSLKNAESLVENLKKDINASKPTRGSIGSPSSVVKENVTPLTKERSSKEITTKPYEKEIEEKPSRKTKSSNFIFYENNRGWNFVTLDQLILADRKLFKDGGKVQEFFFFDRTSTDQVIKDPQGHPIHEHQKIKEFKFTRQTDNEENLRKGLFNHTTLSYDPITKIREVKTFIYEKDFDEIAHMDPTEFSSVITPNSTYNEQRTNNTNTRDSESPHRELIISNIGEEYGDPNGKFVSAKLFDPQLRNPSTRHNWKHLEHASKTQFNNIVLEIDISGNTDLEIGDLIKINIPTENFNRDRVNELDRLFGDVNAGAFFVVSQLRHVFTAKNSNFSTIVQCVKDVNYTTLPRT